MFICWSFRFAGKIRILPQPNFHSGWNKFLLPTSFCSSGWNIILFIFFKSLQKIFHLLKIFLFFSGRRWNIKVIQFFWAKFVFWLHKGISWAAAASIVSIVRVGIAGRLVVYSVAMHLVQFQLKTWIEVKYWLKNLFSFCANCIATTTPTISYLELTEYISLSLGFRVLCVCVCVTMERD